MIEKGLLENVKCIIGGVGRLDGFEIGFFVCFIIFSEVINDMVIVCEEIFGFVLCMFFYDMVDEVIVIVNDIVYGFVVYV